MTWRSRLARRSSASLKDFFSAKCPSICSWDQPRQQHGSRQRGFCRAFNVSPVESQPRLCEHQHILLMSRMPCPILGPIRVRSWQAREKNRRSCRGSTRTAPGPQGVAGRHPRPLSPLDAGLAARLLSGVAPPPADGFATGTPLRGGTLRSRLPTESASHVPSTRPYGLRLDASPLPRVPPRLRRGGGGGFAPRSDTGAGAPQIAGAICVWRLPPALRQPGWGQVRLRGLRSACCLPRCAATAPL